MKHVKENLRQFQDFQFFSLLEEKKDLGSDEKKLKQEEEKEGIDIINKLIDNLDNFKSDANDQIIKYKDFWEENKKSTESFEGGQLYKMFDSDYIAGVLMLPDEALSDEQIEDQIKEVDQEKKEEFKDEKDETDKTKGSEKQLEKEDKSDKKAEKEKEIKESLNEEKDEGTEIDLDLDDETSETPELDAELGTEKEEKEEPIIPEEKPEMGFDTDEETHEYFAVFNMAGEEREEIFRTDSPTVIEKFKDFFENSFKGAMKEQIMKFKQAQEEKKKEAEIAAKEKLHQEKKVKLDKFMKES
ncbi:MAG: hypothetical protein PHF86_10320 [Candidatus Nanoarchaeia archaeon]|nr:hypothetical protein [Candidatus Nanoarchaeia archaeon]